MVCDIYPKQLLQPAGHIALLDRLITKEQKQWQKREPNLFLQQSEELLAKAPI